MQQVHVIDRIDFCREFKKSPGKHDSWSILKEVKHPTTFDWWEFRHCYSSCRLGTFLSVKTHFFIDRGDTYLNKIIKKCCLRFKNDLLIYYSIENATWTSAWTLLNFITYFKLRSQAGAKWWFFWLGAFKIRLWM